MRRITISRNTAVQRIDKMIALIEDNVLIGLNIEAALESANDIVSSTTEGKNLYGAECYNTIANSLALNLAITLARPFDSGASRFHPNKRDIASIPLLVRLLTQKRCQTILRARPSVGSAIAELSRHAGLHLRTQDQFGDLGLRLPSPKLQGSASGQDA
jgi:hypothetical protein